MEGIGLAALAETPFHPEALFAMRQSWAAGARFAMEHPRPTDALLYYFDGCAVYEDGGGTFEAENGSLVLLPRGSTYTTVFGVSPQGERKSRNICMLAEFLPVLPDGTHPVIAKRVTVIDNAHRALYEALFTAAIAPFERPVVLPLSVRAAMFALLDGVCGVCRQNDKIIRHYAAIREGIRYLEEDAVQALSIGEIAAMCHVSLSGFEKQFFQYAGMSPQAFRMKRRIDRAARLLVQTDLTVESVADEVGLYDAPYFCRLFKEKTGLTPGEYRKRFTVQL